MKKRLFALQDTAYRDFNAKLIPNIDPETVIGVRVPQLRSLAKTVTLEDLGALPHTYLEENMLHAFVTGSMKDVSACIAAIEEFLPYIDNWAVCDGLRPKCFQKNKPLLLERIRAWIRSEHPYTVRFAIEMLMLHFLDEDFSEDFLKMVSEVANNNYYVNMMIAWYFATALAKQYDAAVVYLEKKALPVWIHNKTVQKSVESFRITPEQKAYLKTLRI